MLKNFILLGLCVVVLSGCSSSQKVDAPAVAETAETIAFTDGFFSVEGGENGATWRWMGPEGIVRLRNTHQPMVLTIKGRAPVEQLSQPPTLSVQLNGRPLDQIEKATDSIEKSYRIPAADQGSGDWSEVRIRTSESFVPRAKNPTSGDTRQLGFSLYTLAWRPE